MKAGLRKMLYVSCGIFPREDKVIISTVKDRIVPPKWQSGPDFTFFFFFF